MKTTIKIHDTQWFNEHCKVIVANNWHNELIPKYTPWQNIQTISWGGSMRLLEGQVLEVRYNYGNGSGAMNSARYYAGDFWIPNWAIEWVKEELYTNL